jgi:hypothetical protein
MVLATCPVVDQSASIIRQNMAKVKLLTVAGSNSNFGLVRGLRLPIAPSMAKVITP